MNLFIIFNLPKINNLKIFSQLDKKKKFLTYDK